MYYVKIKVTETAASGTKTHCIKCPKIYSKSVPANLADNGIRVGRKKHDKCGVQVRGQFLPNFNKQQSISSPYTFITR